MSAESEMKDLAKMGCDTSALRDLLTAWLDADQGKKPRLKDCMPLFDAMWQSLPALLDMAEANAALSAQVEELTAELAKEREDNRDIPTIAYMSGAADWKARATRAEAALSEQALNIVIMTHMHDALRKGLELLAELVEKAEAELDRVRVKGMEWMDKCTEAQNERDEARAKCDKMRERMIEVDHIASGNRVWAGVNGYKYGGLSDVRHKKIHAAAQAALAECGSS